MHTSLYIAKRYLFAKKSHHIINYISIISVIGVLFTTAALIIVLSVFNGFEKLVISLFNSFNPELLIQAKQGKTFHLKQFPQKEIQQLDDITYFCPIMEENGLVKYKNQQSIVTIKGVDSSFAKMSQIDTIMVQGKFSLKNNMQDLVVLGYGVAYNLQSRLSDYQTPIQIFVPNKSKSSAIKLEDSFRSINLFPSGYFSLRQDYDESYIFIDLHLLQQALGQEDKVSQIEIGTKPGSNIQQIQEELQAILGPDYIVKNRLQQQALLLKVMQSEKAMVYLILGFILLIATFNIIGSISMLIVDKKQDMQTLKAMGASKKLILQIFAWEGMMISLTGGVFGLLIGGLIAYLQQTFGFVSLGEGGTGFVINAYPVQIMTKDFVLSFVLVISMSALAVIYPLKQLAKQI
ncbi:MAG: hypothetical protein B7C24_09470 [Bacteroidetes bacterium 4572_77]|nr:MAG: hypothetical protein B7C24_09470 [Bacteroidetes bacterium 4572_77]